MSTSTEITRLTTARNNIRTKLVEMGLSTSTAKMDALASAIVAMENRGAVSIEVQEGDTYTIPKGYHNGSGTVSGVKGGGNYTLQSKTVTPTKTQQNIVPDTGSYGLSDVTVEAIPENYQDVSSVDATAADVLANKKIVLPDGELVAGTMPNNGKVEETLAVGKLKYTIPKGYHNGEGYVQIVTETKSVTPTESLQTITPTNGKVLTNVTVNPIPSDYIKTDDATAIADQILDGATAYVDGELVEGAMPNNGAISKMLDAATTVYAVPAGYTEGGNVGITLQAKQVTPTKTAQTITPDSGYVIGSVEVAAIPDAYQDVTSVDATAADVLAGKTIVDAEGTVVEGAMTNNGAVSRTLSTSTRSYIIPEGYHDGSGEVSITLENKTATPTKTAQNITPSTGKVLGVVTVEAIPDEYQDVSGVTATAADVLDGKVFVDADGTEIEGTMANNGAISKTMDGLSVTSVTIPAGYTSGGTVSLTSDIEEQLAAI